MPRFKKVTGRSDAETVAALADEIWNKHFVPIIGQRQVDYMLERYQSPGAVEEQIRKGYKYYIVLDNNKRAGYTALLPEESRGRVVLSKIYIKEELRGQGLGSKTIEFVRDLSGEIGVNTIQLRVNRFNTQSIEWYKRRGFVVSDRMKQGIGKFFFMDDYIMTMRLES